MSRIPPSLACAAVTLVTLSASIGAQNKGFYSPPFLSATEGHYHTTTFGASPDMRYQMVDGENRGMVAGITGIAVRLDSRNHSTSSAMGRTWNNVTIDLAEGDVATFSDNFSTNLESSPVRVFSASVTWPSFVGTPPSSPTPWGGAAGGLHFPFSTPWLYLGQKDIVSDWSFTGGTLANSGTWSNSRSVSYYLDGFGSATSSINAASEAIPKIRLDNSDPGVTGRCNDSAFGATDTGAYLSGTAAVYGAYYSNMEWRDKLVVRSYSYYTAPGAPVLHAWGFSSNKTGVDLGTGCNRLHLQGPMIVQSFLVPPMGANSNGYSGYKCLVTPWTVSMSRLQLTMQAAWVDSQSGQMNLTQARHLTLPDAAPQSQVPDRNAIYLRPGASVSGPYRTYSYNPALRYSY